MEVKGRVDSVWSETKNTRAGDKTIWYADVEGTTINMGFKPVYEEGETISVNVEEKYGELQIARGPSKRKSFGSAPAKAAPSRGSSGGSYKKASGFPINPTDSQVSIIRQSSLNRAVDVAAVMIEENLASAKTKDEYMDLIWELAYAFTDFGTGQREVKEAKEREVKRAALEAVNG